MLFSRSRRALANDPPWWWVLRYLMVAMLSSGWALWFCLAEVPLYEHSSAARLEVSGAMHPLQAQTGGRLTTLHMTPGQEVAAGEILVELEAEEQRLELAQERTRLESIEHQLPPLHRELAAQRAVLQRLARAEVSALEEAQARLDEARVAAELAAEEAERQRQLLAGGRLSQLEWNRAQDSWQRLQAEAEAAALALQRQRSEWRAKQQLQVALVAELEGELAELTGGKASSSETIQRLQHELELCLVRAPVAGRVAEVASMPAGAMVAAGDTLGALIPSGQLQVIAEMNPASALGRILPGQSARVRLHGFSWLEFGTLSASVAAVAGEVRNGSLRVELELASDRLQGQLRRPGPSHRVELQHGMPATVQIEVERVSPVELVLRAAGRGERHRSPGRRNPGQRESG